MKNNELENIYSNMDSMNITNKALVKRLLEAKDVLEECMLTNEMFIDTFKWLYTIVTPEQKDICDKAVKSTEELQNKIKKVIKGCK